MTVEEIQNGLRKISDNGYISLYIKTKNTEQNAAVHNAFRQICKEECDDDYTQGLKMLINAWQSDFKYESLWEHIVELQKQVKELKGSVEKEEENRGVF